MNRAEAIVLHTSASSYGDAAIIDAWHRSPPRGWKGIGYHFVVLNGYRNFLNYPGQYDRGCDGLIETGRPLDDDVWIERNEVGAHALGLNAVSVGVCLIGKYGLYTFQQFRAVLGLLSGLVDQFHLDVDQVVGHYEVASGRRQGKTCPDIEMESFRSELRRWKGAMP